MNVSKRLYLIRIAEKIDKNKKYADKIGTQNKSKIQRNIVEESK